jgi:DNA-binding NarL/FixJ family response regulator
MSPVDAAFRLYISTPAERIRTHYRAPLNERAQGKQVGEKIPEDLIAEVDALHTKGAKQAEIYKHLRIGRHLYDRIRHILARRASKAERSTQILDMLKRGVSERTIAAVIGVSRTTVQNHKRMQR